MQWDRKIDLITSCQNHLKIKYTFIYHLYKYTQRVNVNEYMTLISVKWIRNLFSIFVNVMQYHPVVLIY